MQDITRFLSSSAENRVDNKYNLIPKSLFILLHLVYNISTTA